MAVRQSNVKALRSSPAPAQAGKSTERRSHLRYPFSATALITEVQSQARNHGRVSDIGVGGCYIDMLTPLPVGSSVYLELTHNDQTFKSQAVVIYAYPGLGMGLGFTQLTPEHLEVLQSWLAELGSIRSSPAESAPVVAGSSIARAHQEFLRELVRLLIRKGVLTERESQALLSKLSSLGQGGPPQDSSEFG
jgi:hypothetical protein